MFKRIAKRVVAVGLALCMVVGVVLITPLVSAWGYECITPYGDRPYNENED